MSHDLPIIIAEDDEADIELIRRALRDAEVSNPQLIARDGHDCIHHLRQTMRLADRGETTSIPCLLLLDIKMPGETGMDVLKWLRLEPILRTLPVIIFSSSGNQLDVERAYVLGANAFVVKPATLEERAKFARSIKEFWLEFNLPPIMCTEGLGAATKLHASGRLLGPHF